MFRVIAVTSFSVLLAGCVGTAFEEPSEPVTVGAIETRSQFLATLVGPALIAGERNSIQYMPDGWLWGGIGEQSIVGFWEWRGDTHCQTTEPPIANGCQKWFV